jgi:CheY-like chemotaxis protein
MTEHPSSRTLNAPIELTYLVDDDDIFRLVANKQMSKHPGFDTVEIFENGQEALEALQVSALQPEQLPALILLDLNMPVLDGWGFLDQMQQLPLSREIVVVIVTSSIDPQDIQKAKTYSEVKDFVAKPLTESKLTQIARLVQPE